MAVALAKRFPVGRSGYNDYHKNLFKGLISLRNDSFNINAFYFGCGIFVVLMVTYLAPFYAANNGFPNIDVFSVEFSERMFWFFACALTFRFIYLLSSVFSHFSACIVYIASRFHIAFKLRKSVRVYTGTKELIK
ncbi:MAG: hypothetical protein K2N06_03575 [Oscillospiraceae bacterium]|nr:hypothetical protein [Oscillospiraceae bacterium]